MAYRERTARAGLMLALCVAGGTATASAAGSVAPVLDGRNPAWSPDGTALAFQRDSGAASALILANPDGSGVRAIAERGAIDQQPAWAPDGGQIAFRSDRSGSIQLHVLTLATGEVRQLTLLAGEPLFPDWAPHGGTIAFTLREEGRFTLWLVNADGAEARPLLSGPRQRDLWPRWSPDGGSIAFFSRDSTAGVDDEIHLHTIGDSTIPPPFLVRSGHDFCPAWSPDGRHLAFATSNEDGRPAIRIVEVATRREVASIGRRWFRATEPAWSPDGRRIAYAARADPDAPCEIVIEDAPAECR